MNCFGANSIKKDWISALAPVRGSLVSTVVGTAAHLIVLKESVMYYLARGNCEMFVCTLDISKEYDRVSHYRLSYWIWRVSLM